VSEIIATYFYEASESSLLFNFSDRKIDQKKNTQFKYSTRRIGGTKARLMAVAGTHNFPTKVSEDNAYMK
jgi:hypothetical protein